MFLFCCSASAAMAACNWPTLTNALIQTPATFWPRGYGATAARLTPDQKVGSSNLSALNFRFPMANRSSCMQLNICLGCIRRIVCCAAVAPKPRRINAYQCYAHVCRDWRATRHSGTSSPHRLVVRTSRCGRDNPGSTPGVDIFVSHAHILLIGSLAIARLVGVEAYK